MRDRRLPPRSRRRTRPTPRLVHDEHRRRIGSFDAHDQFRSPDEDGERVTLFGMETGFLMDEGAELQTRSEIMAEADTWARAAGALKQALE